MKSLSPFLKVNFQSIFYNDLSAFLLIPILYLLKLHMIPNSIFYEGLIWIVGLAQVILVAKSISKKSHFSEKVAEDGFVVFFSGLGISLLMSIVLFALDYYVVYLLDNSSFSLSEAYKNYLGISGKNAGLVDFLYLSTVTTATVGYGDITASIDVTKILSVCQMSLAFIVFTYILQNFSKKNKPPLSIVGAEQTGIVEANYWKNLLIPGAVVTLLVLIGQGARLLGVQNIYEIWTALYFIGQLFLLYALCYFIYWNYVGFYKERKELRFFFDKTALINLSYSVFFCTLVWMALKVVEIEIISIITIYLCVILYSILFAMTLSHRLKMQIKGESLTQHLRVYFSFVNFTIVYGVFLWEMYVSNSPSLNFGHLAFSAGQYTFLDFFYFSMTTFFTVGFGDIVPLSSFVKSIIILKILISIFLVYSFINNYGQLTQED